MATQVATKPAHSVTARPVQRIEELPGLGSILAFNHDRLSFLQGMARACGDVGRFHFGPFPALLFNSSELVHSVLVEHAADFYGGPVRHAAFGAVTGNGLLVSEGEFHRRQRKAIAPAFQPRQIKGYADTMVSYAERAQADWRDGMVVDVDREMTHITI